MPAMRKVGWHRRVWKKAAQWQRRRGKQENRCSRSVRADAVFSCIAGHALEIELYSRSLSRNK